MAVAVLATLLALAFVAAPDPLFAASRTETTQPAASFVPYGCGYTVRSGDTLYSIAVRYGTSTYALAAVNRLYNPNFIYSGMTLSVPCQNPGPVPPPPSGICNYYIVRPGEYLALIAARYNTTWLAIARLNNIANPNVIYAGMRLAIPCGYTPPPDTGWKTFVSTRYHYKINYPATWTVRVNTSVPPGAGSNPEFVTIAPAGGLPSAEIDVLTGAPPFTGYENCARNWVFHRIPACKLSMAAGQNPAADIWVFKVGEAHFRMVLSYLNPGSAQVLNDMVTSFDFFQ
jgi:LysM repeat protein